MTVPFLDLKQQYQSIRAEILSAITTTLDSGKFVLGPDVERFEQGFSSFVGTKYAVGVNSGTSALHLAFLALGIGPGDEVITVPHTFVATVAAIRYTGARAILVDCDPVRFTMSPEALESTITSRTKAIVPVHLYGQCADMAPILAIANRHGIPVIEDAAQAHGATYKGQGAGTMGVMGCFSFYPGKNLGAYGEGGAVVTNDSRLAAKVAAMRDWGQEVKGIHVLPGYNYRMEGIQGAILGVKLRHLATWITQRQAAAARYDEMLSGAPEITGIVPPAPCPDGAHAYHLYVVRVANRDAVRARMAELGVQTGVHYALPVHLQPSLTDLGYGPGAFPVAEQTVRQIISLPMFPELTEEQGKTTVDTLRQAIADVGR